jgi:hypothetical protein
VAIDVPVTELLGDERSAGEEVSDDRHGGDCEPAKNRQSYF